MFYVATDDADTNVNDDEAKQIKISYIELITKGTDKNGRKVNMNAAGKAKTYKRMKEMLKEAKKADNFSDYAAVNTESRQSEVTIGKDTKLLDKEAVDAAFSLKKGKMTKMQHMPEKRLLLKNARRRCLKKSILSGSQSQVSI